MNKGQSLWKAQDDMDNFETWGRHSDVKAAYSVTFDLLLLELMFLFFKNTVKKTKIQAYILPIS